MLGIVSLLLLALTARGATPAPMQLEDSGHAATLSALVTEEPKNSGEPPAECRNIVDLPEKGPASKRYVPVRAYNPLRNAIRDVQDAVLEANRTGRNVLIQVGGKWCGWCRILDRAFQDHPQLLRLRDENFVSVTVNYSDANKNKQFLDRLPRIPGYPHLFVLDERGNLLVSQNTYKLEQGRGYGPELLDAFLRKWSPQNSPVKCRQDPGKLLTPPK